jgi:branched-chain amino acid transport system substrate-binding protein
MGDTRGGRCLRAGRTAFVAVAALGLVSACSSSSKSSSTSSTTTGSSSAIFGTPDAATGTAVKIGYITDGQNGSIDNLTEIPAAQAAAKYANAYLGGIGGAPISLDVCNDQGTPSGATTCANQMIADKVPAVLNNVSAEDSTIYSALSAAGVPYVAYQTSVAGQLTGKLSYVLSNGLAADFGGPAQVAKNDNAKRAAELVINVPGAAQPAQELDPIIFKNAGIPVDVVPVAPGTPDMTPQEQAEISKGADFFSILGDVSFCTSALKGLKTINYTGPVVLISQCLATGSAAGIPGGYAGDTEVTVATTSPSDPDVQLYEAAMSKWAAGTSPFANGVTQGGFATVLAFARAMKGLTLPATSASIEAAFKAMAPTPLPFGGGEMFQCNGTAVTITPDVCSAGALSVQLNAAGNPTGAFTPLNVSALLKL